jgi:sugar lactone lactonase YvrE
MLCKLTRVIIASSIAVLSACSSVAGLDRAASIPNALPDRPARPRSTSWRNVYLLNQPVFGEGYVSVYAGGTSRVQYELKTGMTDADSIIFDPSGNAYVYNGPSGTNCIIVFAAQTKDRLYTINGGTHHLGAPAIDKEGNLYVPIADQIFVYGSGSKKIARKIKTDVSDPSSLAFDSENNLYVSNLGDPTVVEFAAGSNKVIRTLKLGDENAYEIAIDASDNLYVLGSVGTNDYSITVFASNATSPTTTITDGLSRPHNMVFDSKGDLFVLNASDITAYRSGANKPYVTFARNTAAASSMAIDAANNLSVAYMQKGPFGVGSFKVYALESNKLLRKVSRDVNKPTGLAIGP